MQEMKKKSQDIIYYTPIRMAKNKENGQYHMLAKI
jgi:hypothetical protein